MKKPYKIVSGASTPNSRELADWLAKDGQLLIPLVELLEKGERAIDEVIDVMGRATIEAVLQMSAAQVAGPKEQGRRDADREVYWHGVQAGRVALKERQLQVDKPRLRKKRRRADEPGEVEIPAYTALQADQRLADRMLELVLRGVSTRKYEGRNRFHTDWKEPKLLILYVVGDDGRPSQTWAPIIDGTLRGPEAVFALLLSYARQIGLNAADKVLFIADGAPWIWRRLQRLIAALGLSPTQVLGLIDFYHAAKQLSDAVKLRRWSATQRTRWLNRTRGLLKRARVDEVITALRELCRGRTAGKFRTHLNYFLKNRHRFAYTTMVGLGLPRGSGAVESAIRRVINLRIKGASIYWLPESVDAILLLRSFYKSGRWNCLQRMAMTPVGVSA